MRIWGAALGLFAAIMLSSQARAQSASCDVDYVIQDGDTLPEIAETAFGRRTYTLIYARNFGVIVQPGNLPVGETIVIPCLPGDASQTPNAEALAARMNSGGAQPEAAVAAAQPADEGAAGEDEQVFTPTAQNFEPAEVTAAGSRIRILTASGQGPYSDEKLRRGGMATELTQRALGKLMPEDGYEIVFINDRTKHLRELLVKGSFDVGYPWIRPQCDVLESLRKISPEDAWLCENFEFSEPFYELVSGFFVLRDSVPLTAEFEDFSTSTICRPSSGGPLNDLAVRGITEEFADIYRPKSAKDCLQMMLTGFVDATSADVFEMEAAIAELGLEDEIKELPDLSLLTSINALAPRTKRGGIEALDSLNQGMLELKLSGEWYRVVARHLAQN